MLKPAKTDGPFLSVLKKDAVLDVAKQQPGRELAVVILIHYGSRESGDAVKHKWTNLLTEAGYQRVVFLRALGGMQVERAARFGKRGLGLNDFEGDGGQGADGGARVDCLASCSSGRDQSLARQDIDDQVAFEAGLDLGGIAAQLDLRALADGRYLPEGDSLRRLAQLQPEPVRKRRCRARETRTRAVPPAGIFTGVALRIFSGIRFMKRPDTATSSSLAGTRCR